MKSAGYFSDGEVRVDTVESVAAQILDQKKNSGEIALRGIPVQFDLTSGHAELKSQEVSSGIHNEYDFPDAVPLVKEAIAFISKCELLKRLVEAGEPQIKNRIRANHVNPDVPGELHNLTPDRVDTTLRQIQRAGIPSMGMTLFSSVKPNPTLQAVSRALGNIDDIAGMSTVEKIMSALHTPAARPSGRR